MTESDAQARPRAPILLAKGLAGLSGISTTLILILLVWSLLSRRTPIPPMLGAIEISEVLLVVSVYCALALTDFYDEHIAVDILVSRLGTKWRRRSRRLSDALSSLIVGIMIWATAPVAVDSFVQKEFRFGIAEVPIWPARAAIVVGLLALLCHLVFSIYLGRGNDGDTSSVPTPGPRRKALDPSENPAL